MTGVVTKMTVVRHPVLMYRLCGLWGLVEVILSRGVPFLTVVARRLG
jgi:hypothetical protein